MSYKMGGFSKILIICLCIGTSGYLFPSLNKAPEVYYSQAEEPLEQTTGGDGLQYTEESMSAEEELVFEEREQMVVEGSGMTLLDSFDLKNGVIGGVFGYLLTTGLDLLKKLFFMVVGFIRRKK